MNSFYSFYKPFSFFKMSQRKLLLWQTQSICFDDKKTTIIIHVVRSMQLQCLMILV